MEENAVQINGEITINVNVSVENIRYVKKIMIWNPATCSCENGKYLTSIMDDSVITCDGIIESYNKETSFNEEKAVCKTK